MLQAHQVDVVFDVGAAKGAYGRELRDFGYRGRIVSFEPLGGPHALLVAARGDDPSWASHHCALGSEPGTATMHVASNSDSSSLLPLGADHLAAAPDVTYLATEEVEIERLDDVAESYLTPSSRAFLKLDTQGFEKEVLAGAGNTLGQCVGLQVEMSFVPLYDGGVLVDEVISMMYDEGFRLVGIDPGFASPDGRLLQADGVFFRA